VADLAASYPEQFRAEILDVTDTAVIRYVVNRAFACLGRVDVVVSNAGYGLWGSQKPLTRPADPTWGTQVPRLPEADDHFPGNLASPERPARDNSAPV
jgi:NAD(P)-dependent dehydrogenase (short-subunit alcohol dehydrogenase family)